MQGIKTFQQLLQFAAQHLGSNCKWIEALKNGSKRPSWQTLYFTRIPTFQKCKGLLTAARHCCHHLAFSSFLSPFAVSAPISQPFFQSNTSQPSLSQIITQFKMKVMKTYSSYRGWKISKLCFTECFDLSSLKNCIT